MRKQKIFRIRPGVRSSEMFSYSVFMYVLFSVTGICVDFFY